MKPLIDEDSILYKKRLVRELNQEGMLNGFYAPVACHNVRCNRARLKAGVLECRSYACSPEWFTPSTQSFCDHVGREIVASRSPR